MARVKRREITWFWVGLLGGREAELQGMTLSEEGGVPGARMGAGKVEARKSMRAVLL
jgi:hypothetical protein